MTNKPQHLSSVVIAKVLCRDVEQGASTEHLTEASGYIKAAIRATVQAVLYDENGELRQSWGMIGTLKKLQEELDQEREGAKRRVRA